VRAQNASSHADTAANSDTVRSAEGLVCLQLLSLDEGNPLPVPRRCDTTLASTQRSEGSRVTS